MSFVPVAAQHSEHYLLIAAQRRWPAGTAPRAPRPPRGIREIFWQRVFAPLYRLLPWPLRHKIMLAMPGSHRRTWAPPPTAAAARRCNLTAPSRHQPTTKGSLAHGADRR